MWVPFLQTLLIAQAAKDDTLQDTPWGVIGSVAAGFFGLVALYFRQRGAERTKELEIQLEREKSLAQLKAAEAEVEARDKAEIKKASEKLYQRVQEIAESYRSQKEEIQKISEQRAVECAEKAVEITFLKQRIAELEKRQ